MIGIILLVGEDVSNVKVAAPGNIDPLESTIEIDAVHALNGREICDFFAGLRIHDNHPGGVRVPINNLCVFSSNAPSPFRWLLRSHVDTTSRFFVSTT